MGYSHTEKFVPRRKKWPPIRRQWQNGLGVLVKTPLDRAVFVWRNRNRTETCAPPELLCMCLEYTGADGAKVLALGLGLCLHCLMLVEGSAAAQLSLRLPVYPCRTCSAEVYTEARTPGQAGGGALRRADSVLSSKQELPSMKTWFQTP